MFPLPSQPNPPYPHQDPYQNIQQQQSQPQSSLHARERDQPRDPSVPSVSPHRPVGVPLHFTTGQFTGKHVRAELIELQKADLDRKYVRPPSCSSHIRLTLFRYARKDRRPLDPPPVVQLKFFNSFPGTDRTDAEVDNYELRVLFPCFFFLPR